jgi:hypothetical protein
MKLIRLLIAAFLFMSAIFISGFTSKKEKKVTVTYQLWSVLPDYVSVTYANQLSMYVNALRTNLTSHYNNDINYSEYISDWCESVNPPWSSITDFVDQTDPDQVGLVKFRLEDGVRTSVMEFVAGDALQ